MPIKQAPRGGGEGKRRTHFPNVKVARKEMFYAWMAGSTQWCICHSVKPTKPCLKWLTGDELRCPWCETGIEKRTMGYVPFWKQTDTRPGLVLVYDDDRDRIDQLTLHKRVMIGRGVGVNDTIYVIRAEPQSPVYQSHRPENHRPVDLTESLLRIWGIEELKHWYYTTQVPSDNAMSPDEQVRQMMDGNTSPTTLNTGTIEEQLGVEAERARRTAANAETARTWMKDRRASTNGRPGEHQ